MSRTWKDNAEEFAALDQGEGWPFAILVACSVWRFGQGKPTAREKEQSRLSGKVSAAEFADASGTTKDRVIRYLTAWDKAADDLVVPDASSLTPDDVHHVTLPEAQFGGKGGYYDGSAQGGGLPTDRVQATKATTLVEKMTTEQKIAVAAVVMSDPVARRGVEEAAELAPIMTREQMRNITRDVKEHEAKRIRPEDIAPAPREHAVDERLDTVRIWLAGVLSEPDQMRRFFDGIDMLRAEYLVDGEVRPIALDH